jgi:hypothetical protein
VGIHVAFDLSEVLFALKDDRIAEGKNAGH